MDLSTMTQHEQKKYARRYLTLAVLTFSLLLIALGITVLNVAIPTLQRELGASASALQWIINAYILVFAGLLLTMGALGDRFGRRRALQAGLIIFGLASVGAAYAQDSAQLIAARAAQGFGGALIMPSTLSVIVDVFPREERAKAIGIWAAATAFGLPLGMILGGWLVDRFFWGSVFLINVPVAGSALVASRFLVPESRDPRARKIDFTGALISVGAMTALIYTIIEAPGRGWGDPLTIGGFVIAFVLTVGFILYELRAKEPMLDMRFFRNARLTAGAASIGIAFMVMMGMMFILTLYLQFARGYSGLETGLRFTPLALGFMVGAPTSAVLVAKLGAKWVMGAGLLIIAGAIGGLALVDVGTAYWLIGIGMFIFSIGMANTMAPATDAVMAALPEEQAGVGSALNDTVRQLGGALGIAVFGSIFNSIYSARIVDAVVNLSADAAAAAKNSIGGALQVAADGPAGDALRTAASSAFVDGLGVVYIITAGVALLGAAVVFRFMPARDVVVGEKPALREGPLTDELVVGNAAPVPVRIDE